jgi:phosphatidylglycerol:prolipoprotein diacylglycerol transferase
VRPVLFEFFGRPIAAYGLLAATGWMLGIYTWSRNLPHMRFAGGEREFWRLVYLLVAGSLVGGKLLAIAYYGVESLTASLSSGFVYLGGMVGSGLCGFFFCKVKGYVFFEKADFFASGLAIGHAVGRLGCLFAGCCHGRPTDGGWGVRFTDPMASVFPRDWLGVPLYPTQIYELAGELAIFLALIFYFERRRIAKTMAPGLVSMAYLAMYGAMRFVVDFWRGDDPDARIGPLTTSQAISLVLIASAVLYARRLRARAAATP